MKRTFVFGLLIVLAMWVTSCDDDNEVPKSKLTVMCENPEDLSDFKAAGLVLEVNNLNSTEIKTFNMPLENDVFLEEGVYTFTVKGECEYTVTKEGNQKKVTSSVKGIKDNVKVIGKEVSVNISLFLSNIKSGFVFEEIFFAGTLTPEGNTYRPDNYFEIYNNSDQVLYADGLSIAETKFNTTKKENYSPDIMSEAVAVSAIYTIPGDGNDYPVQPGESLLICDQAINHKENNTNSFDLSKADFEWFDDHKLDIDNTEVTNLIKTYASTLSVWTPSNKGNTSFILCKLEKTAEEFLAENKYDYTYEFAAPNGKVYPMKGNCYKVPNSWVIDAVALSTPSDFEWMVIDPSLDFSYTHSGDSDDAKYGKSVRRKVAYTTSDGRKILMDSNNSEVDFIPTATPTPGTVE